MPENKIIPVNIPAYSYNVAPTDIGSGYAAGISQAGKSIAGAISGIMGGVDAAGNVTHGVLEQNQTVNDTLSWLATQKNPDGSPVLSEDAFNNIMGKGLGARQQVVGALMGQFQTNLKSQQELQQQIALEQARQAAAAPYRVQEIRTTGEEQRKTAVAARTAAGERPIVIGPNPNASSTSDSAAKLGTSLKSALDANKPSVLNKTFSLGG